MGHEKEDAIFAGAQSAEFWMYDARIGRRWDRDPVVNVSYSPYSAFAGNPIFFKDIKGLAPLPIITLRGIIKNGFSRIKKFFVKANEFIHRKQNEKKAKAQAEAAEMKTHCPNCVQPDEVVISTTKKIKQFLKNVGNYISTLVPKVVSMPKKMKKEGKPIGVSFLV